MLGGGLRTLTDLVEDQVRFPASMWWLATLALGDLTPLLIPMGSCTDGGRTYNQAHTNI